MNLLIVVPAFNEEESIGEVIGGLLQHVRPSQIVVVDDGSIDSTSHIVNESRVELISHPVNLGVGAALKTGFKFARKNHFDLLLQFDADGQHRPDQIDVLLQNLSDLDILIGSRFGSQHSHQYKISKIRRAAIGLLSALTSKYLGSKVSDVTSGFRLYNKKAIDVFAELFPNSYLGDTVESLFIAKVHNLKVGEIPVAMQPRLLGSPSHNFFGASLRYLRTLIKIASFYLGRSLKGW